MNLTPSISTATDSSPTVGTLIDCICIYRDGYFPRFFIEGGSPAVSAEPDDEDLQEAATGYGASSGVSNVELLESLRRKRGLDVESDQSMYTLMQVCHAFFFMIFRRLYAMASFCRFVGDHGAVF